MCNLQFAWFLGTLYNTTKAIIAALINGDVKYALVEKSELEFYVKYMQSEKEVHLGIVDLYENKNDVGMQLYGELKKLSNCLEQFILENPNYLKFALENRRKVKFTRVSFSSMYAWPV